MAAYKLLSDWEEPNDESETGYVRHLRGEVFDVPDKHLDRLLRIGALAPVDDDVTEPDDAETVHEDSADDVIVPTDDNADDDADSEADSDAAEKETDTDVAPAQDDVAPTPDIERPKQTAAKDVWVDYAVARGMARDDAEALDKRELIAALS